MQTSTAVRVGIAGAVTAAGLAVGGMAIASADDAPSTKGAAAYGPRGGHGPGFGLRPGGPGLVGDPKALAEALDVDQEKVADALKAVREDLKGDRPEPGERPDPADRPKRSEVRDELTAALAKELGVSEEKLTAALKEVREDARGDRRDALEKRLAAAVEDDTLSEAEQAAVLKAFDAGLLGGPAGK